MEQMQTIDGIRLFGEQEGKNVVVSFLVGDIHHMDIGTLLDRLGIAVRTGHHCAQPLMDRYGILWHRCVPVLPCTTARKK